MCCTAVGVKNWSVRWNKVQWRAAENQLCDKMLPKHQLDQWLYLKLVATKRTICFTSADRKAPLHISALLLLRYILYRSSTVWYHGAKTYCCSACCPSRVMTVPCDETCTHDCHVPRDCRSAHAQATVQPTSKWRVCHFQGQQNSGTHINVLFYINELCMMYQMTSTSEPAEPRHIQRHGHGSEPHCSHDSGHDLCPSFIRF